MPNEYVTLAALKDTLGISGTDDDEKLLRWIRNGSRAIDQIAHRKFYPRSETRYFDHPEDETQLRLDDDLLEIITFATKNGDTSVASADYFLMRGDRYSDTPYSRIVLKTDGNRTNLLYSGTMQRANEVTGIWGYHTDWSNAWLDSGDTVQSNPLTAAATSLTVSDADGADDYGDTPRFTAGQLLKIESEYVHVTATDTSTNVLTILRGRNGTTAAQHPQGTAIFVFQPEADVVEALVQTIDYTRLMTGASNIRRRKLSDFSVDYVVRDVRVRGVLVPGSALGMIPRRIRL